MMKLAVILSERGQHADGRRLVVDRFSELGARQTAGGIATLSFEIPDERFVAAFGDMPPEVARDGDVVGASGPWDGAAVPVPQGLSGLVEDVSVPPPARRHREDL